MSTERNAKFEHCITAPFAQQNEPNIENPHTALSRWYGEEGIIYATCPQQAARREGIEMSFPLLLLESKRGEGELPIFSSGERRNKRLCHKTVKSITVGTANRSRVEQYIN
jgi:hypothetical protein